ncbi:MAG: hypothetical protein A3F82_03895 [Deltaproteobacteria bacterium RIFCSPLOWO2_12_FULL_44_12]|nr:MAG: hypothetical protein A2712_08565 [Deltaproteobacteria bacterium RIFCSPHIGHO2_01_FULL_43_49]OGQ14609.1 MAG: hypothetical protein A3D22_08435 [Deltaproteobacteria bacterium RIFCSPHIGHO2_02_FULL_44_53]OGQ27995.1 MAG: hypothetical protein A3D98_07145 [Deltaproteobacteria bacterium RIFCSPHIGHO2_12_FULL_44_21]OGQ31207.1 MAG: hypothetical protein A2979_07195 [Deltaproteobacteria bacterium RIFCSPLOWO2_01_FULL_45_74]OGQ43199.1 MAG: hypothetical protein A3I70_00855 [Deltaproteobacteria bacterium 
MKRWLLWVIIIFSMIGMAGSFIATQQYFRIQQTGFEQKSFCDINEFINCDIAYASSHAQTFGIPTSWLGLIFYLWMGILAFWILRKPQEEESIGSFAWLLSLGGFGMTIYKAYTAFFILKVLCLICLTMYLVNIALLLVCLRWASFKFNPKWLSLAGYTAFIFGIGWIGIASYQSKAGKRQELPVPIDEIVSFHFRQSQYQFEVDAEAPVWGNPNAKVTVVEFSDFQCPYCKHAAFHLKPSLAEFKNKVKFYFYHYPLDQACNDHITQPMHDKACLAAQAAVCAGKMNDFWSYHDDIFRNQKNLSSEILINLAKQRGWDEKQFNECISSPETISLVKENVAAANKIYVTGTPTVLVNNRLVKYWSTPDVLKAIIKEEIKKSGNQ